MRGRHGMSAGQPGMEGRATGFCEHSAQKRDEREIARQERHVAYRLAQCAEAQIRCPGRGKEKGDCDEGRAELRHRQVEKPGPTHRRVLVLVDDEEIADDRDQLPAEEEGERICGEERQVQRAEEEREQRGEAGAAVMVVRARVAQCRHGDRRAHRAEQQEEQRRERVDAQMDRQQVDRPTPHRLQRQIAEENPCGSARDRAADQSAAAVPHRARQPRPSAAEGDDRGEGDIRPACIEQQIRDGEWQALVLVSVPDPGIDSRTGGSL